MVLAEERSSALWLRPLSRVLEAVWLEWRQAKLWALWAILGFGNRTPLNIGQSLMWMVTELLWVAIWSRLMKSLLFLRVMGIRMTRIGPRLESIGEIPGGRIGLIWLQSPIRQR